MVKKPEAFANEKVSDDTYLDDAIINSSNVKQDSVIVEEADVRPNDHKVLGILSEDRSRYTFRGLMRKLGMHQESLSRSLHRLDELGLIEKSELGYKLSRKGEVLAKGNTDNTRIAYVPLLQTYVPPNIDVSSIVDTLAGRWFKNLRWLGMVEGEMGHMLQWTSEDGSFRLNIRIIGNYIIIETNANGEIRKVEAMVCAYRIFEHICKLYNNRSGNVLSYIFSDDKVAN
ncbi:MAG: ArsR family transcriptional regulator [Nitrososphaerales archaeon]